MTFDWFPRPDGAIQRLISIDTVQGKTLVTSTYVNQKRYDLPEVRQFETMSLERWKATAEIAWDCYYNPE